VAWKGSVELRRARQGPGRSGRALGGLGRGLGGLDGPGRSRGIGKMVWRRRRVDLEKKKEKRKRKRRRLGLELGFWML